MKKLILFLLLFFLFVNNFYFISAKDQSVQIIYNSSINNSFDFKANDLEGRQGTKIISGGVVKVDTLNPSTILEIVAVGYDGEIKLDWHYNGDYKEFNIYRSLSANPDFTDFYKISGSNSFNDKWVEDGKTYYYRVSVIDDAGNEGELSSQVYATSLLNNVP